ncbi:hypothetical protein QYE76_012634 [Lolium multiflorum]|uniref:Uncharacterized protein n=1 Tax=Lolium multiflorum TaxID=4521 RepID=A0AAD8U1D3_LOLMU|nr:hypothetical protein QYE76_012634 [Lolium multiflorum]
MAIGAFVEELPGGAGGGSYSGRVTPFVVLTCVVAGSGGILFGYDLGISGSAIFSPPPCSVKLPALEFTSRRTEVASDLIPYNLMRGFFRIRSAPMLKMLSAVRCILEALQWPPDQTQLAAKVLRAEMKHHMFSFLVQSTDGKRSDAVRASVLLEFWKDLRIRRTKTWKGARMQGRNVRRRFPRARLHIQMCIQLNTAR